MSADCRARQSGVNPAQFGGPRVLPQAHDAYGTSGLDEFIFVQNCQGSVPTKHLGINNKTFCNKTSRTQVQNNSKM
eukprot:3572562-Amphidinium_carterae.1